MTSLNTQWHRFQQWLKSFVLTSFFRHPKIILTYHEGDIIKYDGRVLQGTAYVDESAIAGVSSPALISASSPQCNVLAGTLVTEGTITVESDAPEEKNPLQELRESRHTIRVNLAILENELLQLNRLAKKSPPSADLTAAKTLLENAQGALMLEFSLSTDSCEKLGEILRQVFEAMNQSTRARHLLKACVPN